MVRLCLALLVLAACGPSLVTPQTLTHRRISAELVAARHALTAAQIRSEIVGNSISGVEGGIAYFEYLAPDGNIYGVDASGPYHGNWRVDGDQLCFIYDADEGGEARSSVWDCNPVTREGTMLYWSDEVGEWTPAEASLVKGNPRNLGP